MTTPRLILLLVLLSVSPAALAQITETYTFTTNRVVPDGNAAGLQDVRSISSAITSIASVQVRLRITGEFNGDLYGYVRHSNGFVVLLNRPGKTAAQSAGYPDSGFDVTFQTAAANGDIHLYRQSTTPSPGAPLTGIWQPDGRRVDPALVTEASTRNSSLTNFNGLDAAGEWTLYLADLESGGTNMLREWALIITGPAYPALAWATPADITYGTALANTHLNAVATHATTNVPGTFTYTPALGAILQAGTAQTLSVTFTPANTISFRTVSTNVTVNVLKAPLSVRADNKTKVYGAPLPARTATYTGFVLGEGTDKLTALAALSTTATAASPVGSYPITASGVVSSNYALTYIEGSLAITPASTIAAVTSSANPAPPGSNITFTATLSAVAPGVGTPSGQVNFRVDGSIAGSGALAGGAATFTTSALMSGAHTVIAEYAGDANFIGATNTLSPNQFINTPPVAGNDVVERYASQGVKVQLTTLLANDSDADGDTLAITVGSTSVNGGSITVSNGWVFYVPPVGFTNSDSFSYSVADGRGATATATVSITIKEDDDPGQNLTITDLGEGSYRIRGSGIPDRTYRLQYTETLTPANWRNLPGSNLTASGAGIFEFIDTSGSPLRFYRSVYP